MAEEIKYLDHSCRDTQCPICGWPDATSVAGIELPKMPDPNEEEISHTAMTLNQKCGLTPTFNPTGIAEKYRFYAVCAQIREAHRERQLLEALREIAALKEPVHLPMLPSPEIDTYGRRILRYSVVSEYVADIQKSLHKRSE